MPTPEHTISTTTPTRRSARMLACAAAGVAGLLVLSAGGCKGLIEYKPGGMMKSLDEFTYESTAWQPLTVTLIDTRDDTEYWSVDVPQDKKLTFRFYDGEAEDSSPLTPDMMRWEIYDDSFYLTRLRSSMPVPPADARRVDVTIRQGPEFPEGIDAPPLTDQLPDFDEPFEFHTPQPWESTMPRLPGAPAPMERPSFNTDDADQGDAIDAWLEESSEAPAPVLELESIREDDAMPVIEPLDEPRPLPETPSEPASEPTPAPAPAPSAGGGDVYEITPGSRASSAVAPSSMSSSMPPAPAANHRPSTPVPRGPLTQPDYLTTEDPLPSTSSRAPISKPGSKPAPKSNSGVVEVTPGSTAQADSDDKASAPVTSDRAHAGLLNLSRYEVKSPSKPQQTQTQADSDNE